jgi:signal peptidase I
MTAVTIMSYVRDAIRYVILIAVAVAILHVGRSFSCVKVDSNFTAMQPEISDGAVLLIDRRPVRTVGLDPGDIICFTHTSGRGGVTWVGRIAALEGDSFELKGSVPSVAAASERAIMVPRGHVLVAYEHSSARSLELNKYLVPVTSIKGRVMK